MTRARTGPWKRWFIMSAIERRTTTSERGRSTESEQACREGGMVSAARSLPRDSHLAPMAVKKKRTESLMLKGGGGVVVFMERGIPASDARRHRLRQSPSTIVQGAQGGARRGGRVPLWAAGP